MIRRCILAVFLAVLMPLLSVAPAAPISADEQPRSLSLPPALAMESKLHPKLESRLSQLVAAQQGVTALATFATSNNIEVGDGAVRVIIDAHSIDDAVSTAKALGATLEGTYANLVQAIVPLSVLVTLSDHPSVNSVRLPEQFVTGAITGEGVTVIGAPAWQQAGYKGAGVKVAVVDLGFKSYSALKGTELPNAVVTRSFRADQNLEADEVHGTACAEIVFDIAPEAQLYLVNFSTSVELGNAVDWLVGQGVSIISASFGSPTGGPGDGTGFLNDIVASAKANGILWVNAAMNSATGHWGGLWNDSNNNKWLDYYDGDETNNITASAGQTIQLHMRWDDTWGAPANDYDLYLYDSNLNIVGRSENRQSGGYPWPVESIYYAVPASGTYHVAILKYLSNSSVSFDLFSSYHDLLYRVAAGSLSIPADSANAMTVGAVNWSTPNSLESFSSQGPTKDGRIKPDLVAPDAVKTSSYGSGSFYGTSAAAPHAAGAAALVKQRFPGYAPVQIQSFS